MRVQLNKEAYQLIKEIRELGVKYGVPIAIDGIKMESGSAVTDRDSIDILFYVPVKIYFNSKFLHVEP